PNFLFTDCGDASVPLEICADGGAAAAVRNARIAQYQDDAVYYWRWDVNEDREPPDISVLATA
ncbi:MAG: hypothetical protein ACR2PS_18945, partial [Pseudomonadales bacterium]